MKGFGNNLKTERIAAGLSQTKMAHLLGVKQQQLSQWECDKVEPTLYNIAMILKILEIKFEDLTEGITLPDLTRQKESK